MFHVKHTSVHFRNPARNLAAVASKQHPNC
nr:MAG TPA: hypothetical protein [Caudoviricetes sp.]